MKLIQINAAAKLESPEYQGPFLPAGMLNAAEPAAEKVTLLQSSLREALAGVLGSQDNGRWDVHTIYGWQIGEHSLSLEQRGPVVVCMLQGDRRKGFVPEVILSYSSASRPSASSLQPHQVQSLPPPRPGLAIRLPQQCCSLCAPHPFPWDLGDKMVPQTHVVLEVVGVLLDGCCVPCQPHGEGIPSLHGKQHPQDSFLFLLSADAEMVLNSENKPLPLKDFAAPHLPHSEGTKPLPPGARRWVWAQLHQAWWEGRGCAVPVAGCRQQRTVLWGCQRAKVTVPS